MSKRLGSILLLLFLFVDCGQAQSLAELSSCGLPVLQISTENGVMPSYDIVYAPDGCLGVSITNNDYVPGRMVMTLGSDTLYDSGSYVPDVSGMQIKCRGNSTGAYLAQHPYRLSLVKKADLLRRNDPSFKHKKWLLMSMYTWNSTMSHAESNILNVLGTSLCRIFEKEWVPAYEFVQVVLNGAYQGMYYLIESVDRGQGRVDMDETGFLIEHDVFWWNEDRWFRTDHQRNTYAFTFKYPGKNDITDFYQNVVHAYMNELEQVLYAGGDISQFISIPSFAKWILIQDVLGTVDAAGTNRYLCKYDMDLRSPYSTLLQMGPLWDFDSSFKSDTCSHLHLFQDFYFPWLFKRADFVEEYVGQWNKYGPTLMQRLNEEFASVWEKYGETFDKNMALHRNVYRFEGLNSLRKQLDEVLKKVEKRVHIVNNMVSDMGYHTAVGSVVSDRRIKEVIDLRGHRYAVNDLNGLPSGVYVVVYDNGSRREVKK